MYRKMKLLKRLTAGLMAPLLLAGLLPVGPRWRRVRRFVCWERDGAGHGFC